MKISGLCATCFFCIALAIITTIRETCAVNVTIGNNTIGVEVVSRGNETHNDTVAALRQIYSNNENTSTTEADPDDFEYGDDFCSYNALNSSYGHVSIGCNASCLVAAGPILVPNGTLCAGMPFAEVLQKQNYMPFNCTLGFCNNGTCASSKNTTMCEKMPVMTVGLENARA
uniref:Evasin n=1 Tax=Rhipicephalus appendiculatus TaxID=34631 RepID=A0A131YRX0_RHIAP